MLLKKTQQDKRIKDFVNGVPYLDVVKEGGTHSICTIDFCLGNTISESAKICREIIKLKTK